MNLLKPIASLTSDLLARKGGATPASLMFPLAGGSLAGASAPRVELRLPPSEPPKPRRAEPRIGATPPKARSGGGTPPGRRGKSAKVSLRLDADRHQRLRLVCLHAGMSGQQVLLAALDEYLDRVARQVMDGKCACLQRTDE